MYKVYVLYSFSYNKLYIGFSSCFTNRILSHNLLGIKDWTRSYRPWTLIHLEIFDRKTDALRREKELKAGKGREYIRNESQAIKKDLKYREIKIRTGRIVQQLYMTSNEKISI